MLERKVSETRFNKGTHSVPRPEPGMQRLMKIQEKYIYF